MEKRAILAGQSITRPLRARQPVVKKSEFIVHSSTAIPECLSVPFQNNLGTWPASCSHVVNRISESSPSRGSKPFFVCGLKVTLVIEQTDVGAHKSQVYLPKLLPTIVLIVVFPVPATYGLMPCNRLCSRPGPFRMRASPQKQLPVPCSYRLCIADHILHLVLLGVLSLVLPTGC